MMSKSFKQSWRRSTALFLGGIFVSMTAFTVRATGAETLFFASDVHNQTTNLSSLLSSYGTTSELACLVGDYGASTYTTSTEYTTLQGIVASYVSSAIYSQGNHERYSDHYFSVSTGWVTGLSNDNYEIYVINPNDFSSANTALASDLASYDGDKVVLVMSHYPLHSTRSGLDQTAEAAIFTTLQTYGQTFDIVFLWGHNHSSSSYDTGVDYVALPGGTIGGTNVISAVATATLNFTYLNAGYVNPISGTSPSATVITIDGNTITIERHGNAADSATVTRINKPDVCGDGTCVSDNGENACSCYEDCGYVEGSCDGYCGGQGSGDCWCDAACAGYGDCCPDKKTECGCCGDSHCRVADGENACNCYNDCGSAAGSCTGACGGQGSGGCWCDAACAGYGDCCPDKKTECGCCGDGTCVTYDSETSCNCYNDCGSATGSCAGVCGGQSAEGCWCDEYCGVYGDCCSDKQTQCGC